MTAKLPDEERKARQAARDRAYREANRERDRDKARARKLTYYERHRDEVRAKKAARYQANQEQERAKRRAYYEANRDDPAWSEARKTYNRAYQLGYFTRNHDQLTELNRERQEDYQEETRPLANSHYQPWSGPELEVAARADLTAKQAALMLGRTYYAVESARKRLRHDPKFAALAGMTDPDDKELDMRVTDVSVRAAFPLERCYFHDCCCEQDDMSCPGCGAPAVKTYTFTNEHGQRRAPCCADHVPLMTEAIFGEMIRQRSEAN